VSVREAVGSQAEVWVRAIIDCCCCWSRALCLTTQVHLHEHAGLVYVDSDGGSVTAWLSPSGTPLGLQVKAAGGVSLDPALKVSL
jgi:hypothetical protein